MRRLVLSTAHKWIIREMYEESKKTRYVRFATGATQNNIQNLIDFNLIKEHPFESGLYTVFQERVREALGIKDRPARKIKEKV